MQAARQLAQRSLAAALTGSSAAAAPWAAALAGGGAWRAAAAGGGLAAFHAARSALSSLQVKIPALGESISDGTVAAVLKQAGDRVEEDEPILQVGWAGMQPLERTLAGGGLLGLPGLAHAGGAAQASAGRPAKRAAASCRPTHRPVELSPFNPLHFLRLKPTR